jgi:maleate cis-trans isomerase
VTERDMTPPLRLGFLYPGHSAEDDLPLLAGKLSTPVEAQVAITSVGEDAHRVDALLDLGGMERLAEGVAAFRGVTAVVWACTSGSFVFGWDGARQQADDLERVAGVPASSTSFAFVNAARALGVTRVAVAATYPADVAERFRDFLTAGGLDVAGLTSSGIITAEEVGTVGAEVVAEMARAADRAEAEAVLLPDTALHTVACLPGLEQAIGKPVLTANQVSVWEGLRLAGRREITADAGELFTLAKRAA